ncbi:MAG: hypothetical protein OXU42_10740, partial [Deltaproteobacteria bacterium]|nr:hypothetical protein [Deltaproteobacteria bacterium]
MEIEVLPDADAVARRAAAFIADAARAAVRARGLILSAPSRGRPPGGILRARGGEGLPREAVGRLQV